MKKILKYLLFITIFVISTTGYQNVFADSRVDCINSLNSGWKTGDVSFTKIYGHIVDKTTTLTINTTECIDVPLEVTLYGLKNGIPSDNPIDFKFKDNPTSSIIKLTPTLSSVTIKIKTDENSCYGSSTTNCTIYTEIKTGDCEECLFSTKGPLMGYYNAFNDEDITSFEYEGVTFASDSKNPPDDKVFELGNIMVNCDGACAVWPFPNKWEILKITGSTSTELNTGKCIESLNEDNAVSFTKISETEQTTLFKINAKECKGIPLQISFWGNKHLYLLPYSETDPLYDITFPEVKIENGHGEKINPITLTPKEDVVTMTLFVDDDSCNGLQNSPDCLIYTEIKINGDSAFNSQEKLRTWHADYFKNNKTVNVESFNSGVILTDCEGPNCLYENWKLSKITGAEEDGDYPEYIPGTQKLDPNNPCYVEDVDPETEGDQPGYEENCYEFLAPIQGIETGSDSGMFTVKIDSDGNKRIAITDIRGYELGNYINKLFQIAIAILGVMSVIMIIIAGVQYMTVESIYGKSDAKQRITAAVSGLLLSLSIFIILNTINPELLEVNFGSNFDSVSVLDNDGYLPEGYNPGSEVGDYVCGTSFTLPSEIVTSTGIFCPSSGGTTNVKKIVDSFKNKVTYRYGGKGGNLPDGKGYLEVACKFKDGKLVLPKPDPVFKPCENGSRCGDFCPEGTFCIDCSGFTGHVLKCAGLVTTNPGGTSFLFGSSSEAILIKMDSTTDLKNGKVNGYDLLPGDLVGKPGHVAIYIGDGKIAESTPGRIKGTGILISNMADRHNGTNGTRKWLFTHLRKASTL